MQGVLLCLGVTVGNMVKADLTGHVGGGGQGLALRKAEGFRPVQHLPQQRNIQRLTVQLGALGQNTGHPTGKAADRRKVQQKPDTGNPWVSVSQIR